MTRMIVMGIVMAFAIGFVGCRSCMAPYDACQPTFIPERGDQCMGELYRCGSILGGMEQTSNANGYCESCGGGSVEYYSATGQKVESTQASTSNVSIAQNQAQPAPQAAPQAVAAQPLPRNEAPRQLAQRDQRGAVRSASFQTNEFTLNNDSDAY